jgi:PEP-CTERM motif-containing protein
MTLYANPCCFTRMFSMATGTAGVLCVLMGLILPAPARAAAITLGAGVTNPPPSLASTGLVPTQVAIADTATLVQETNFASILQLTLNAQGFTAANNWTLGPVLPLADNATFNITQYNLCFNTCTGGGKTIVGAGFGEDMDFTLDPNLAVPATPAGSTVTEHWLQVVQTNAQVNGYGFPIVPLQGYWQADNGQKNGGKAAGAGTGPYYDSNSAPGDFSTPPKFHDLPAFYLGAGTYLHFDVFPTWDIFTPAAGKAPASDTIDVGSVGLAWGFQIVAVPEPSTGMFMVAGLALIGLSGRYRFTRNRDRS